MQSLEKLEALTFFYSAGFSVPWPPAEQKSKEKICYFCDITLVGIQRKFCSVRCGQLFWNKLMKKKPQEIKKAFSFKRKKFEKPKLYKDYREQIILIRDMQGKILEKKIIPIRVSKWSL